MKNTKLNLKIQNLSNFKVQMIFYISTFLYPSKPKDITNPFAKSYPQTLCAGFELHSFQIVCTGSGRRPAEYCQQDSRKQADK